MKDILGALLLSAWVLIAGAVLSVLWLAFWLLSVLRPTGR